MDVLEIKTRKELEAWFEERPPAVAQVVAARAALRALPFCIEAKDEKNFSSDILLPVFWAVTTSWVARKYPTHDVAAAADSAAASFADSAASAAFASFAASFASFAADSAASVWKESMQDCAFLEDAIGQGEEAEHAARDLAGLPLWRTQSMPSETFERWNELKIFFSSATDNWQFWWDWYQARLSGTKTLDLPSDLLETLDVSIATLDESLWEQGPAAVNAEIWRLMDEAFEEAAARVSSGENPENATQEEVVSPQSVQKLNEYADSIPYGLSVNTGGEYFSFSFETEAKDIDVALEAAQNGTLETAKNKLQKLADGSARLANNLVWQDLPEVTKELINWFSLEPAEMAESVVKGWHLSVSLGTFLEQNDEIIKQGEQSSYDPLAPDIKRSLVDANASISTIIREFPTGEKEDEKHNKWRQSEQEFVTIKDLAAQIGKHDLLIDEHAKILALAVNRFNLTDAQGKKNASFATGTTKKVALGAVGLVLLGAGHGAVSGVFSGLTGEIGAEISRKTGLSKKAAEFIIESPDKLREALKGAPPDVQASIEAILKQVKKK